MMLKEVLLEVWVAGLSSSISPLGKVLPLWAQAGLVKRERVVRSPV